MARKSNKKRADGYYKSQVTLEDGSYKYLYAKSQKELDDKLAELRVKVKKGWNAASERDTFGEWVNKWLALKKVKVSHNRLDSDVYRINNFTSLFDTPISKIKTSDLQACIFSMQEKGYAAATMNMSKMAASGVFKLAISNRVTDFNSATGIIIPQDAPKEQRRALTTEEQAWINAPTEHRAYRAAMIMMYAGLRRGELIPLQWRDIDLDAKTITVNKAVEIINGKSIVKSCTKTAAGMRVVYIPQVLVDYLANENEKRGEKSGEVVVCPSAKGKMMSGSAWKRLWESYLFELNYKFGDFEAAGCVKPSSRYAPKKIPFIIPRITAHWLRHTFITSMYLAGVDIMTAKEQAGHADIKTTMEIYTHLDSIYKVKQINKLDEYYSQIQLSS